MKSKQTTVLTLLCCLLLWASVGLAQSPTTGEIAGQVSDPQGAAVANATITLTAPSGVTRETKSDGSGRYRFPLLDPGPYSVAVNAPGFAAATRTDARVRITETTTLDVQLTVAGTKESVSVVAEQIVVQDNATTGRVIGDVQVNQLPLPTRNYTQLLALSPGAVSSLPNNAELGRGDADINVNGQRSTSNNVMIDGTEANSPGTNTTPSLTVPPPDAIQEFIVQTSMYDASQGRNSGGNVSVVTKSGTNKFHGNAFEYFRNDALNANDFFLNQAGDPRPELKRNQFGFTFGGPLIKDKTFFFFAYQGTRERNGSSPTYSLGTTLIPQDLTNDRSTTTLTNTALNDYGVPLSPVALGILQATLPSGQFAIPSAASPLLGSTALSITPISGVSRFTEDYFNINIDQQVTAKNKLSGKFLFSNDPQYQAIYGFLGPNPNEVPGYGGDPNFHNRMLSLADTHIFTPHLVNEVRFGFSRIHEISLPQEPFTNAQFGITNPLAASFPGMATIEVPGLFTIGSSGLADNKSVTQTWQAQDMVSYTAGRHFLRFGAQFRRYDIDFYFHAFSRGEIIFNDFQDFLAGGSPTSVDASLLGDGVPDRGFRASDGAGFVQDDIHLTSNLTVNAGIRLDHFGGYSEIRGRFSTFDPVAFAQNTLPCVYPTNLCTQGIALGSSGQQLNPSKYSVSPRIGFAWSPRKQNDVSVRGGFGMFYDRFSDRFANLQVFNYPYDVVATGLFTQGFFGTPFPNPTGFTYPLAAQAPSPIPLLIDGFIPLEQNPINGFFASPNMKIPYTLDYNLDVQYSFAHSWLADVGYLGNRGNHLINLYNFNQGLFGTSTAPYTIDGFSNNKALFGFDQVQTEAESRYNALQASLTKRFSHGLQFLASYTWSHSIDNNSGDNIQNAESELNPLPGDQQNLASQFGPSDFDRKHRFVFSGVYDLPAFYKGSSGFAKSAANNWETTGLMVLQTGLPFTVYCSNGTDLNNRADLSGQPVVTSSGSTVSRLDDYFNAAAFNYCTDANNIPPFGTSARNFLRGPGQKDVDFGVVKFFSVTEGSRVEFRAEFFNLFNFVNFAQPYSNTLSIPNGSGGYQFAGPVGAITSTNASPRIIQFALKYNF